MSPSQNQINQMTLSTRVTHRNDFDNFHDASLFTGQ